MDTGVAHVSGFNPEGLGAVQRRVSYAQLLGPDLRR